MSAESLLQKPSWSTLCYSQPTSFTDEEVQDYLIYFLTGNPGAISYYQPFLSRLYSLLASSCSANARFHICGHSYRGFELLPSENPPDGPYGLVDQIHHQESLLLDHVKRHKDTFGRTPKVILMGHSVGAYVVLELIRGHVNAVSEHDVGDFDLIGGILLFPTIAELAQSPLGRIAKVVLSIPGFALAVGALARGLTYLIPGEALKGLVKIVTRFSDYAGRTTAAFLKSPMGVRQALYLARDEMRIITEAKWDKEVWGAATSPGTNKRDTINWNLMVYWGQKDRWVADHTRDKLMQAGGYRNEGGGGLREGKSRMEIDVEGIPHDFCTTIRKLFTPTAQKAAEKLRLTLMIGNSYTIAEKARDWIDDIIEAHSKAI
ncbi:MAG: hypothetical protein Q9163_003453 [Psora crenata]